MMTESTPLSPPSCLFPLFRKKYLPSARWTDSDDLQKLVSLNVLPPESYPPSSAVPPLLSPQQLHKQNLRLLDVRLLHREDLPLTESQVKLQKYQYYAKHCSQVAEGLYLGGDLVAKDREILRDNGITHVVNCVGFLYPEYFKDELVYKTLFLQDHPTEDILCLLCDVLEFIDTALAHGGRVLIHCSQGVSRSATFAIAYVMWRKHVPFDEAFGQVKDARGVVGPNIGFTVQLMNWHKRRIQNPHRCRIYRVAPHGAPAPQYLVLRTVQPFLCPSISCLDIRGAFIIQSPDVTFVWQGARCPQALLEFAWTSSKLLHKFENAPFPPVLVQQGSEPEELLTALALNDDPTNLADALPAAPAGALAPTTSGIPDILTYNHLSGEVDNFTPDYNLYYKHADPSLSLSLPSAPLAPPPLSLPTNAPPLSLFPTLPTTPHSTYPSQPSTPHSTYPSMPPTPHSIHPAPSLSLQAEPTFPRIDAAYAPAPDHPLPTHRRTSSDWERNILQLQLPVSFEEWPVVQSAPDNSVLPPLPGFQDPMVCGSDDISLH